MARRAGSKKTARKTAPKAAPKTARARGGDAAASLRRALLDLGAEAFDERPALQRHLAREIVRALARRPWRVELVDRTAERRTLTSARLLGVAAALARHFRRTIPGRRVGIVLPPGIGAFIANLAVSCAGKVPVNLNFTAGRSAVEAALRLGEIDTVITAEAMKAKVPGFPFPPGTLDLVGEIKAAGGKRAILPWVIAAWVLPNQWFANVLGLPHRGGFNSGGCRRYGCHGVVPIAAGCGDRAAGR